MILRGLRAYEAAGVEHHIVVVGHHAEQVIEAVGRRHPNATFVYQGRQLGTGHAAKCGARVLQDAGFGGEVLVAAGDKLPQRLIVEKLVRTFRSGDCDLAFVTDAKERNPTSGRVVADPGGRPAAIVEVSEIKRARLVEDVRALVASCDSAIPGAALLELFHKHFPDREKARKAGGDLYAAAAHGESVPPQEMARLLADLGGDRGVRIRRGDEEALVSAAEAEDLSTEVNLSLYLYRADALYYALERLSRDNAQGEEYLTDTVEVLGREALPNGKPRYELATVPVSEPTDLLAFNTPEELAEIERALRARSVEPDEVAVLPAREPFRSVAEWRRIFESAPPELDAVMREIYGPDGALLAAKRHEYLSALELAASRLGPESSVLIVRSPGRINLLGRHIDHRGGNVNVMAISEEILMVVAPRTDDQVHLHNTQAEKFEHTAFSIGQEIARLDWDDWLTCVNSPKTLAAVGDGHWGNYVKAAALRLQYELGTQRTTGADIVTHGTIPIGSGLSSSSAIVVGAAEALVAANGLRLRPSSLVDLCGEGEWFVGTRGGSSDHAAIKFAKRGQVAHIGFFPFEVKEFVPFPQNHGLVVCDSGEVARKSEGAREAFNSRVLGYLMGELIFKKEFTEFAPSIEHLRDIGHEKLGVSLAELYRMLKRIPVEIGEQELLGRYGPFMPEDTSKLGNLVSAIEDRTRLYQVRGQMIYGLAECERAALGLDLLRNGDVDGLGRLWQASHDGDRVVQHDEKLRAKPFAAPVNDEWLDGLAERLESGDPRTIHDAHLHRQIGFYGCSTPAIDRIVDVALRVPGVKGAQLAGAGLGGCAMVLAEVDAVDAVIERIRELGCQAAQYHAVMGAGVISL